MARSIEFIMTAGPVELSDGVRSALGNQLLFDYSQPFLELFRDTEQKFKQFLKTGNDIVMMQGEALLGLEGVTITELKLFGKAEFGNVIHEVKSRKDFKHKGEKVKVVAVDGDAIIVE